jgi:hypothetical protein
MKMAKRMTYVQAMMDFFGLREGQNNVQFMREVREAGNREFYTTGLQANGYEIITATTKP